MIAIINYGLGNLASIANMLKVIGVKNIITSDVKQIESADKLILPGVGSFDAGIENLNRSSLADVIKEQARNKKKPILGICLGMQLLGRKSEEGKSEGLSLIPFNNVRFQFDNDSELKIPHMGWDVVDFKMNHPLADGLKGQQRYYFVHSYYLKAQEEDIVKASTEYGVDIHASVEQGNVFACQFHPEKSSAMGLKILQNFARMGEV